MKFWFVFPIALLMLSPIWLDRMQDRMDGIAEGGSATPIGYDEGGSGTPPGFAEGGSATPTR